MIHWLGRFFTHLEEERAAREAARLAEAEAWSVHLGRWLSRLFR